MNESILLDITEKGILASFDKDGRRIPMNKREGHPFLIKVPEYILVIMPWKASFRPWEATTSIDTYASIEYVDGNDLYSLRREFFKEWMPAAMVAATGLIDTVRGIELITTRLPIVKTSHELLRLADSGYDLRNYYIFKRCRLNHDSCDWSIKPRFEHVTLPITSPVLENIQSWFRELLGLQNPVDAASLYPKFTTTFNPPAYNHMYEKIIKDRCTVDPWLAKNPNMRLPDGCLKGRRLTDSESTDLIFDGDVPHGNYITALDVGYCKADVLATMEAFKHLMAFKENNMIPGIKKVIFNKPATIVLWEDGTKTIVRTQGKARFDKEKGLAMCIAKKALGNKGNYYDEFRKWVK